MARSSRGPRQATTWAAEQNPRPLPRIVVEQRGADLVAVGIDLQARS